MAWCCHATTHYLIQCWPKSTSSYNVMRPQWVKMRLERISYIATASMSQWHDIARSWWRHQMERFSALLAICAGNSPVTGEFPAQRQVTRSFGVSFDLRLNIRLSKQSWGWWFETPSRPLWRRCNVLVKSTIPKATNVMNNVLVLRHVAWVDKNVHLLSQWW